MIAEDGGETHSTQVLLYGPDDYAHVAYLLDQPGAASRWRTTCRWWRPGGRDRSEAESSLVTWTRLRPWLGTVAPAGAGRRLDLGGVAQARPSARVRAGGARLRRDAGVAVEGDRLRAAGARAVPRRAADPRDRGAAGRVAVGGAVRGVPDRDHPGVGARASSSSAAASAAAARRHRRDLLPGHPARHRAAGRSRCSSSSGR